MTEKDTKVEEVHDEEFYDDYNENDNYYIDKALGNIKDDPGSVRSRPRRIPVYKIQLSDEDKIPKMPENILREPNDAEYQKKIDDLKAENKKKKKSIEELIEKRKQERMGVKSDDKQNVFQKMKDVNAQIKDLSNQIKTQEDQIAPIRNKFNALKDKLKNFERYKLTMNPEKLAKEIKKIKEKISFSAINVTQETELINRKDLLEDYQKHLIPFINYKKENQEKLGATKEPRDKRKKLLEERDKLDKEIKKLKEKKEETKPEINQINDLIEKLKKEKAEISQKIRDINYEWNQKWYEYNEQQKLIQYIKEANARIKGLKKREKKENKKSEKEKTLDPKNMEHYMEFNTRLKILQKLGYIDEHNIVTLKGKAASEIGTTDCVLISELLVSNILEKLNESEIVGFISGFCSNKNEIDFNYNFEMSSQFSQAYNKFEKIFNNIEDIEKSYNFEDNKYDRRITFSISKAMISWMNGKSFSLILKETDLEEGKLYSLILRIYMFLEEIINFYVNLGNKCMSEKYENIKKKLMRDIMSKESLYLQDSINI